MRAILIISLLLFSAWTPTTATAEAFRVVDDRDRFLSLVTGRELTRLGIRLQVTPSGVIQGRAFGTSVTGQWRWENGFFCRTLFYGKQDLGPNCQEVRVNGNKIRFTSDRGSGQYADLSLR